MIVVAQGYALWSLMGEPSEGVTTRVSSGLIVKEVFAHMAFVLGSLFIWSLLTAWLFALLVSVYVVCRMLKKCISSIIWCPYHNQLSWIFLAGLLQCLKWCLFSRNVLPGCGARILFYLVRDVAA